MGKTGGTKHVKRLHAPKNWRIPRKEHRWIVKSSPGPHPMEQSLPLLIIIRDVLGIAKTRREAKTILSEGQIKVNGKARQDDAFPVGSMDVVDIPSINKAYRIFPAPQKGLMLHAIEKGESDFKICKILNKTTVNRGHIQLNLNDGQNILVKLGEPQPTGAIEFHTSDILKIKVPDFKILDYAKFREGVVAMATGGKNRGRWGKVVGMESREGHQTQSITLEDAKGNRFQTTLNHVFALGDNKPWISMPED